jgi:hypothetical protein
VSVGIGKISLANSCEFRNTVVIPRVSQISGLLIYHLKTQIDAVEQQMLAASQSELGATHVSPAKLPPSVVRMH